MSIRAVLLLLLLGSSLSTDANSTGEDPWTTWYRRGLVGAVVELSKIRESLFEHNLFSVYTQPPYQAYCSERTRTARTIDGTCNDLNDTSMGAAGTSFGRNINPQTLKTVHDDEILTPNPREISLELMTREEFKPVKFLNMLAVSWIQFMVHDWFNHQNDSKYPILMPTPDDDPSGQEEMVVLRSKLSSPEFKNFSRTYDNENTHWWDGSQIYGSNLTQHLKLRAFKGGKLKVNEQYTLPVGEDGLEQTGFNQNWWVGLASMHYLFVKEHNSIAAMLAKHYPDWNDQKLFDVARLINSALMAKIHTVEWTPAILDNRVLRLGMNANWYGLLNPNAHRWLRPLTPNYTRIFSPDPLSKLVSQHHILGGIVGGRKDLYQVPFTLTEEFVSVYRMHPLLPDELELTDVKTGGKRKVSLNDTRKEKAKYLIKDLGLDSILFSQGITHPGQLTLNNYPKALQNIELPLMGKVDLAAIDIIRDRERSVPRYNEFRRQIQLKPIKRFEDLFKNPKDEKSQTTLNKLKRLYNNDVEQLDLMVGCLAEEIRPTGYGFGETAFQIFIAMASRRLMTDRFFTTDYRPEIYTRQGLRWIDSNSMIDIIKRHYPSLRPALKGVKTAFNPWRAL